MTLYEACKKVVEGSSAVLIRPVKGEKDSYSVKAFEGNKRNWLLVDSWSASCYIKVYEAISDVTREKLITNTPIKQFTIAFKVIGNNI